MLAPKRMVCNCVPSIISKLLLVSKISRNLHLRNRSKRKSLSQRKENKKLFLRGLESLGKRKKRKKKLVPVLSIPKI